MGVYFVITQRGGCGGGGVFCYHTAGWGLGWEGYFVSTGVWVDMSVHPNSY